MGSRTSIAWTDQTFNPWWGCHKNSPECAHCYAETWAKRTGFRVWGATQDDGERRFFGSKHWAEPLKWDAAAKRDGVRKKVFCASMCDIMEDRRDLDQYRTLLWSVIEQTENLDWQLLTKFPQNFRRFLPATWLAAPRRNVWGMTTVGCRSSLWRVGELLTTPFTVRGVSMEPLLGPVDLSPWLPTLEIERELRTESDQYLDWVIVGGESGPGARPCRVEWIRGIVRQCAVAAVPCFVKQLGSKPERFMGITGALELERFAGTNPDQTYHIKFRDRAGADPSEWPEDLRVQQFPEGGLS